MPCCSVDMPVHIWGHADPDEKISVTFHGQQGQTEADKLGRWSLFLQPEHAGGPYTLTVAGTNTITLHDVLVGDVWFASGQSNMQLPLKGFGPDTPLKNSAGEIAAANHPMIHLLHVKNVASDYEQRDQDAIWTVCSPDTVPDFSAVAYFFGRETQEKQHTPVGLIEATWGRHPPLLPGSASTGLLPRPRSCRSSQPASPWSRTRPISPRAAPKSSAKMQQRRPPASRCPSTPGTRSQTPTRPPASSMAWSLP